MPAECPAAFFHCISWGELTLALAVLIIAAIIVAAYLELIR